MKKIDIPKEKLIELYCENNLTMIEIAKIYNVDRTTISNKLKQFQIDSNPNQRKYESFKNKPLTKEQKDFIVGSTLGDASIILSGRRTRPYFKVSHCEKQKDYLVWKKEILGNLVITISKTIDKRGHSVMYGFNTVSHDDLSFFRKLFYIDNKKIIKDELSSQLSPLGLAVWFMDDGSKSNKWNYRFSTEGFSYEENLKLANMLKINFNLNAKVLEYTRSNKKYHYLFLNKENAINMTKIIKPYIVDCMKYKLIDCSSTTTCQTPEKDDDIV